jgi:hypothetical protein
MDKMERTVLLNYLDSKQPFEYLGGSRHSTLIAGLRDCRQITKRDINTGKYNKNRLSGDEGSWLATIGYFTILDQMGSCFKPIGVAESKSPNSIKYAIESFGYDLVDNDQRVLNALIGLRNSLTHDFNLLNVPTLEKLKELQQHKFTVIADSDLNWIVRLPLERWDGNIEGKIFSDNTNTTFVNLFQIGNLTENIYNKIYQLVQSNNIELREPLLKILNKYTFVIR